MSDLALPLPPELVEAIAQRVAEILVDQLGHRLAVADAAAGGGVPPTAAQPAREGSGDPVPPRGAPRSLPPR